MKENVRGRRTGRANEGSWQYHLQGTLCCLLEEGKGEWLSEGPKF
jgi:hypothetical protein